MLQTSIRLLSLLFGGLRVGGGIGTKVNPLALA
jgi:hypothetical protein